MASSPDRKRSKNPSPSANPHQPNFESPVEILASPTPTRQIRGMSPSSHHAQLPSRQKILTSPTPAREIQDVNLTPTSRYAQLPSPVNVFTPQRQVRYKHTRNPLLPTPPSKPQPCFAQLAHLSSPIKPKTKLLQPQGHRFHPRRQHSTQVHSFPGPVTVCPTCRLHFDNEWRRDVHFMERHLLGVRGFIEPDEMVKSPNHDGEMGKGRHVMEPWRYCEEPEEYADEDGDLLQGKQYYPPANTFFTHGDARFCDANKLPPRARAKYAAMVQRAALVAEPVRESVRKIARKTKIGQEVGDRVMGAQARVGKRTLVVAAGGGGGIVRGRGRSVV